MDNIQLLDCTLRDGGYINNWDFGYQTIIDTFYRLNNSGVEFIEVGFLDERHKFDNNKTIQPSTKCFDKIFANIKNKKVNAVAMIDYGTCSADNVSECKDSFLDGIRIIFKKPNMFKAIDFAKKIKEKGYKVFLQLVSITSYSDRDLLDFIDAVNVLNPHGVSIVDTYGLMHKEKVVHYFDLLDNNLNEGIHIGFHSHNNFQLAYANAIEIAKRKTKHPVILDGSIFGMGKNAGNTPIELLFMYMNETNHTQYDINQIMEIIDLNVKKIYEKTPWGYSLPLFLAASNDCHPNYVKTLIEKNTLCISSINEILKMLKGDDKLNYNKEILEQLYCNYQKTKLCDKDVDKLNAELCGKSVFLVGPGLTIIKEKEKIDSFLKQNDVCTISVNCAPDMPLDYLFVGNDKRYAMLSAVCDSINDLKIIATSNVSSIHHEFDYVLNFDNLSNSNKLIFDNSFVIILKILKNAQVKQIYLAGFDGFSKDYLNYFDSYLDFNTDFEKLSLVNEAIKAELNEIKKDVMIRFITTSLYDNERND